MMTANHCLKICSLVLAALYFGFASISSASAGNYLIDTNSRAWTNVDLAVLGGDVGGGFPNVDISNVYAVDINNAGQVTGSFTRGPAPVGFFTGPNGAGVTTIEDIWWNWLSAINNIGQVAGQSRFGSAFFTGPNGVGITHTGLDFSAIADINDSGQVTGSYFSSSGFRSFITGPGGVGVRDLGTLGGRDSFPNAINNAGQVAGESETADFHHHAFITGPDGVGIRDLGTLGGDLSSAHDINDTGEVVGSFTAGGAQHAFITGPNGMEMRDLGTLGGHESFADGINNAGQVAGWAETATGAMHAFITGPHGVGMIDLNSLVSLPAGVILTSAVAINDHGQVLVHAIPEPQTYALMLAGLGLVGFAARRKKIENRLV
jgi:probable HAF family extracellular repeat protein